MNLNLPQIEHKILNFWKKYQIFERSIEKRKGKKDFVFYEGPPTANAKPGIHHVLSRVFKDIICRFKTMQGFKVERKAGWDTHGLPVELEIEKKLGFKVKKEIENFGVEKFNKECKKSVWQYKKDWEKLTERIGFWLDLKNPYITYDPKYIESVWFLLKKIWEKGLLYEDFRVSPYCPRCQTVLSSHELAQGYKKIKEPAIYVKFKLKKELKTSLLIWTTTPWTLPGNVAVAVNPNVLYAKINLGKEKLILAKERIGVLKIKGKIEKEFFGKELIGEKYEPPFSFYKPNFEKERIWEVLGGDFVSLEEGTGLVHIAPAFGEEDMELIRTENQKDPKFPILINVDEEGKFKKEVEKFAGIFVKEADQKIIQDLKERGLLFQEELYEHDYPFCWRCKTPLLYYAKKSWFLKVTKVKEQLIKNNQKINWIPSHIKEGRFGEWLREVKDWALSRERYWGTPLPVWKCKNCSNIVVIGSREDLKKQKFSQNRYFILRHGESVINKKGILISKTPEKILSVLTEKGKKQILKVAKKLKKEKIDLIFASDLERAKESAEILAKELNVKVIFTKKLRDIQFGIDEGKSLKEHLSFWKSYKERFEKAPKGGENYNQVKKRMVKFIEELERKYQKKTILIVSHERPLAMLEGAMKGYTREEFEKFIEPNLIKMGELREIEYKKFPLNKEGELDFHRPFVDEIKFFCPKCGEKMERVPEVIDCWFDSGAMPFAQYHWPFEGSFKKPKLFPADYIAEGIDQTRGWFYTLLAISTLLGFGPPFKNVICLGHVLDEKGEKMSKSKGNVINPWEIIERYGTDSTRWYFFTINQPSDPKLFSTKDLEERLKKFILTFWNSFSFFKTYAPSFHPTNKIPKKLEILDKWIISRLYNLIQNVTQKLENYDITQAARLIDFFVIEDLSLWYIRRSRKRFQKPKNKKELILASQVLGYVLLNLSKILAPFLPFLADYVWHEISNLKFKSQKSVHLEDWPKFEKKLVDFQLEKEMEKAREVVRLALAERARAKIKVRQPLKLLQIPQKELVTKEELLELIKEEVNVKEITFGEKLFLDTTLTPELLKEGIIREIMRHIQAMRKEMGLQPKEKVIVQYEGDERLKEVIRENKDYILKEANIEDIFEKKMKKVFDLEKEIDIDGKKIILAIKKIT